MKIQTIAVSLTAAFYVVALAIAGATLSATIYVTADGTVDSGGIVQVD